jgi:microcystin degradation protein MlrC
MDLAIDAADSGRVFNASVFGGFPLADVPCAPLGVLVVERADGNAGAPLVGVLCRRAWDRLTDFIFEPEDMRRSELSLHNQNQ